MKSLEQRGVETQFSREVLALEQGGSIATECTVLERSLDPEDWERHRDLGHRMVDDMIALWSGSRVGPTWRKPPAAAEGFEQPMPLGATAPEAVYSEFCDKILPYPTGNLHPRFWSHVIGTGTAMGAYGDFLAAAMNCNVFGGNQVANHVEAQVLRWLGEMLGYPAEASGLLLSGGSMANLLALCVALRHHGGETIRSEGLQGQAKRFRFYCSSETHNSLHKAAEMLGLGRTALRSIACDDRHRISMSALEQALTEDRLAGLTPFCVIGNAVTVGTGAIDPLGPLADLCEREGLWFHIDGAIGALARITPELGGELEAIARSDSVAFDLHKWFHVPYEAGCLLVREGERHRAAFANTTAYLAVLEGGFSSGERWPNQLGPELSRGFKALKVWLSIKEQGRQAFAEAMSANMAQARYLAQLVRAQPELELLAPVAANIVNFRHRPKGMTEETALETHNRRILIRLQESGHSVPSHNRLGGRFALRVAISNHRTRAEDLEALVSEVLCLAKSG